MAGLELRDLYSATKRLITKKKTIYFPGCASRYALPDIAMRYKSLLSDIGEDFVMVDDLNCCGSPLANAGYLDDYEQVILNNKKIIDKHKITKIITNCPNCYEAFKTKYDIEVEHITQTLSKNASKLKRVSSEEAVYHDPCILARHNLLQEPRNILKRAGYKVRDCEHSKTKALCCGASGGLIQNNPELANKMAKIRLSQLGGQKVITSCPYCYIHLSRNKNPSHTIEELSQSIFED